MFRCVAYGYDDASAMASSLPKREEAPLLPFLTLPGHRAVGPPAAQRGGAIGFRSAAFILERHLDLCPIALDFAVLQLHVELRDLRHTQITQRLGRAFHRRARRFLPGLRAGADQLDDFVDTLWHGGSPCQLGYAAAQRTAGKLWRPTDRLNPPGRFSSAPAARAQRRACAQSSSLRRASPARA